MIKFNKKHMHKFVCGNIKFKLGDKLNKTILLPYYPDKDKVTKKELNMCKSRFMENNNRRLIIDSDIVNLEDNKNLHNADETSLKIKNLSELKANLSLENKTIEENILKNNNELAKKKVLERLY